MRNWEHEQNIKELNRLKELGFEFEINGDGYFVKFKGEGIGGASVMLPRSKPIHYKHRQANTKDNLLSAIIIAKRSKHYQED